MAFLALSAGILPATATTHTPTKFDSSGCYTQKVQKNSDGSEIITSSNGMRQLVPPPGFNPLKASAADLAKWGFPPRPLPSDVGAYRLWTQGYGGNMKITPVKLCPHTNNRVAP